MKYTFSQTSHSNALFIFLFIDFFRFSSFFLSRTSTNGINTFISAMTCVLPSSLHSGFTTIELENCGVPVLPNYIDAKRMNTFLMLVWWYSNNVMMANLPFNPDIRYVLQERKKTNNPTSCGCCCSICCMLASDSGKYLNITCVCVYIESFFLAFAIITEKILK